MSGQVFEKALAEFVIIGEPCSKANSRKIVKIKGKTRSIKSDKALAYERDFHSQCPNLDEVIEDDVWVDIRIWYASRRPDLDESIILTAMQGHIYKNDRQVKLKLIVHKGVDKVNPRAAIRVGTL